ncbi:MAG: ArsA family ATPase [Acidimicrobiia bacterium]|nr:AAA family ATPase [Acidimicrobiia bacterium]NNF65621.1 ArsA family ATPase [Acidimicrobiia bacterium]
MTRCVLVTGAGGVGKTTISAALGVTAAQNGLHVLVLTVDPARRLADALGLKTISNEPSGVPTVENLSAAMLDVTAAWEAIVRRHAPADAAERLLVNPFFRAIADRFPAAQAYAAGEEMAVYLESGRWDLVIVDTPPAAGGIDFFAAPTGMKQLVGGKLLRFLTGAGMPGRRALYRVTARPVFRVVDALLGGPLLEAIADFLLDLRSMYDGLAARAADIERHFSRSTPIIATTAEPTPLREADRFFSALPKSLPSPELVVFNRVLPDEWANGKRAPNGLDDSVREVLKRNLARWSDEVRRQSDAREEFVAQHRVGLARVPWIASPPTDVEALSALIAAADGFEQLDLTSP